MLGAGRLAAGGAGAAYPWAIEEHIDWPRWAESTTAIEESKAGKDGTSPAPFSYPSVVSAPLGTCLYSQPDEPVLRDGGSLALIGLRDSSKGLSGAKHFQ
jgi:hypothetical protein